MRRAGRQEFRNLASSLPAFLSGPSVLIRVQTVFNLWLHRIVTGLWWGETPWSRNL